MTASDPPPLPTQPNPSPAPPTGDARSPLSDGEWHRLHPLTPLLQGGLFLLVILGIVVANLRDRLVVIFLPWIDPDIPAPDEDYGAGDPIDFVIENDLYLVAVLVVLAVVLVLIGIFYTSWRFHTFRITGDDVEVRSGILFRTQRRAPLDRVQGVNLTRPMIARLLGMAKLEVVGAGTDANVKLEYLSTTNAEQVRADILRLASGRRLADAAAAAAASGSRVGALSATVSRGLSGIVDGAEAPIGEPESVVHIPVGRLVMSRVLSDTSIFLVLAIAGVVVFSAVGTPWILFTLVPMIIGFGTYWVRSLLKALRYSIAPTPDGVRITFGLLTTITEIVPPGRIHAVQVSQPLLWRASGWWTVRINRLSGASLSGASNDAFTTVLPVGTPADVDRVLRLVLPDVPGDEWPLIGGEGLFGPRDGDSFTTTPRRARLLRPVSWRRNGFRLTPDMLLLRRGAIWRSLTMLPLARMQSFAVHQGPLDRALRIASVRGHTITGPVSGALGIVDRDATMALFEDVARATVVATTSDHSHRWGTDAGGPHGAAEDTRPRGLVPPPPYDPLAPAPGAPHAGPPPYNPIAPAPNAPHAGPPPYNPLSAASSAPDAWPPPYNPVAPPPYAPHAEEPTDNPLAAPPAAPHAAPPAYNPIAPPPYVPDAGPTAEPHPPSRSAHPGSSA